MTDLISTHSEVGFSTCISGLTWGIKPGTGSLHVLTDTRRDPVPGCGELPTSGGVIHAFAYTASNFFVRSLFVKKKDFHLLESCHNDIYV